MTRVKKSGIYRILNNLTGKFYLGRSSNLFDRKSRHFSQLRKGIHHNIHLQRSFNKYGQSCFTFEVLEYTDNLVEKEQEYFDKYNCGDHLICYNLRDMADKIQSDETRYRRVVSRFDLNQNYLNTYTSLKEAAIDNKITSNQIIRVIRGDRKSSGGYKWQYGDSKRFSSKLLKNRYKVINIVCIDSEGSIFKIYPTIKEVKEDFKDTRHIYEVLNNKRKIAYGYKWILKKNEDLLNE